MHAVDRVGACLAEDDHRDVAVPGASGLALAQAPADLRPSRVLEPAHEHEIGAHALGELERQLLSRSAQHLEAVTRQVSLEELPRSRLGLGEEQRPR